jgi:inner membrane protein
MAECAMPSPSSARTRTLFMCVGVVAANAPDVDVLYTGITEEPIGYLLHHRGHSHTLPGLAALALLIYATLRLLPFTRRALEGIEQRWLLLIAAALGSHLLMDAANSYGTHLFYPFSSRWVYGDAVFVIEPWLWAILGATLAMNATRWPRAGIAVLTLVLIVTLAALELLQPAVVAVMLVAVGTAAAFMRSWDRKKRAAGVLIATSAVFALMPGVSRLAKAEVSRAASTLSRGELIDIVSDANPGIPWCWAVLTLQKANANGSDALVARRGTLSLLPGVWPATSCTSTRLSANWSTDVPPTTSIVWHREWQIDADMLRELSGSNCRVRAWLQFGRVPYVSEGSILDLRYETPVAQNFTPMAIEVGSTDCPTFLADWVPPRADVLALRSNRP